MITEYLSTASVGLCPDLKTPLNDVSTHNKVMEYMAFALPIVTFDLTETRVSAAGYARYVPSGDVDAFASAVDELLDDLLTCALMGRRARQRCVSVLDWRRQVRGYVDVFDHLCGVTSVVPEMPEWPFADRRGGADELPEVAGRRVIDLRDRLDIEFARGSRRGTEQLHLEERETASEAS
jgi:hypothetical protein